MQKEITTFLAALGEDPRRQARFAADPAAMVRDAGLSAPARRAFAGGEAGVRAAAGALVNPPKLIWAQAA